MKLFVLAAVTILIAASTAPRTVHAAGQPQLGPQGSAAATNGKTPDQAEASKMELKRQRDAQKYQGPGHEERQPGRKSAD